MDAFSFMDQFTDVPGDENFVEMCKEQQTARIKYLWKKVRIIVRTRGFIKQIAFDRTMKKIGECALDTDMSFELPSEELHSD